MTNRISVFLTVTILSVTALEAQTTKQVEQIAHADSVRLVMVVKKQFMIIYSWVLPMLTLITNPFRK